MLNNIHFEVKTEDTNIIFYLTECYSKLSAQDLIRNKINVSCDCEAFHKGYVFNTELKLCVGRLIFYYTQALKWRNKKRSSSLDFDECYEGLHSCDTAKAERCVNTLGSYQFVYANMVLNKFKLSFLFSSAVIA